MDLNDASKKLADVVNEIAHAGTPIPFIVATMELIKHDLCNQHIAMSTQMREIARGNVPPPNIPPAATGPESN